MTTNRSLESGERKAAVRRRADPAATAATQRGPALHPLLALQRQVGNAQIARMLAQREGEAEKEDEEEGAVQTKPEVGLEGGPISDDLAGRIQAQRGSGAPLDEGTRTAMEDTFGAGFGDVRLHADAEADALNRSLSAKAFTTGSDIFVRPGAYQPGSDEGHRLLSHELTHVVQQRSMQASGPMRVAPAGDAYEQHADAAAQAAASEAPAAAPSMQRQAAEEEEEIQRQAEEEEELQLQRQAAEEEEEEEEGAGAA